MTIKQNKVLEEYAALEEQIAEFEARRDALKEKVLKTLETQGVDTLKEVYGTFSVVYRKKWAYSPELTEKERQYNVIIKSEKAIEQEEGVAKAEEVKGLSYRKYVPNEKEN